MNTQVIMPTREAVDDRLRLYIDLLNEKVRQWHLDQGFRVSPTMVDLERGRRYAKVNSGNHVHTFIDMETGDILKAASWRAPAKNGVRGNIFADDCGMSVVDWHGAKYLR